MCHLGVMARIERLAFCEQLKTKTHVSIRAGFTIPFQHFGGFGQRLRKTGDPEYMFYSNYTGSEGVQVHCILRLKTTLFKL